MGDEDSDRKITVTVDMGESGEIFQYDPNSRRFTMKGSLKKLRCEDRILFCNCRIATWQNMIHKKNGFWISDNYQPLNELYMYFMLNYLCMPKDVPVQELVRKYKGMSTK